MGTEGPVTGTGPLLIEQNPLSEGREWGVGSVVVEFGVFGAPLFSVQRSQSTRFKGFWDLWTENWGAPKTPNSTMTDPTPHSRPSDLVIAPIPLTVLIVRARADL